MVPGGFGSANKLYQSNLASIRLRSAVAFDSLSALGASVSVGEQIADESQMVIVGKIGAYDISARSRSWLDQIQSAKKRGAQICLDYTDHHLGFDSPMSGFYKYAISLADTCVVPSQHMATMLSSVFEREIKQIPDPIEVIPIKDPKAPNKIEKILWFGHASNIKFLIKWIENQTEQESFGLIVLTNPQGFNIFSNHKFQTRAKIDCSLYEWSVSNMIEAAKFVDLCVIPSDIDDPRKSGVSSNRLLTALALGLPTAATMLPSYREFSDYFVDIESDLLRLTVSRIEHLNQMIKKAQHNVLPNYTMDSISKKWIELVEAEL
jgi:hypothetical protein